MLISCSPSHAFSSEDASAAESSAYVFAGGSGADVGLYDLRMAAGSAGGGRAVRTYRPRAFAARATSPGVAVSGIDVSRDGRELLTSYESDHAYTFPVLGGAIAPTIEDVDGMGSGDDGGNDAGGAAVTEDRTHEVVSELATYGGHLNRLTFLKMAKYAGTHDQCESGALTFASSFCNSFVCLIIIDGIALCYLRHLYWQ